MSIAHTLSFPHVSSKTSSHQVAAGSSSWAKVRGAVWNFLESTGRRRGEHAMKHGYYKYI